MQTKKVLGLLLIIIVILVIWGGVYAVGAYNSLVSQRQAIDTQWAQVENQYQRRFDLIPNLVETVKGAFKQEQAVFGEIANARAHYAGASTVNQKVAATNEVESSLARLLVIVEQYPTLYSLASVQTLMSQLEGTENRITVERMRYNDLVRDYETHIKSFPGNIVARTFNFEDRQLFQADVAASTTPKVSF